MSPLRGILEDLAILAAVVLWGFAMRGWFAP